MIFGLVDCANFYVSAERVFDPRLIGKPCVVASNNDGAAIARSEEAKALGIKMGDAIHLIPPRVRRELIVRSANFALYGDLSGRVVSILRDLYPRLSIYSIDECFVGHEGVRDARALALEARSRIRQWTGIPVRVGIGPSQTLSKAANRLAKKVPDGVVDLTDVALRRVMLDTMAVEDVWGVGRRWAARLGAEGILTAGDLVRADPGTLRARYGVMLARTQRELQGYRCIELEEAEPPRQQIVVSRSFGAQVSDRDAVCEAVATFAIRAAEKLRARGLVAGAITVWLNTNPFREGQAQYHPSRGLNFPTSTSDTREILGAAQALARAMYRPRYLFQKAGVGLLDLREADIAQGYLFSGTGARSAALMQVLDQANAKFGRGAVGFAASGWRAKPKWAMRQENLSPAYTTRWDQLLRVR